MSDMWIDPAQDPRTAGDPEGELATYREYLTNYRLTLELKCEALTPEQLATRSVPPSQLSLLGMVRHMARVEHFWFQVALQGKNEPRLYDDGDTGFAQVEGTQECVDEGFAAWTAQITAADSWLETQTDESMADIKVYRNGETGSVRDILVHMIEEYARHCGHADLLRECIDGRTGQ
jgi:uncharacterized damage-inducible protein DinB